MSAPRPSYCVAVIGGAITGAHVANTLVEVGCEVVVFEQNPRPYGKIEDGLPRWHTALRKKEYAVIRSQLIHPSIHYVPLTQIGKDLNFREIVDDWGFTGVVLASGAWRDRTLPIEGADRFVGRGLIYQNPFVIWFNHMNESNYKGPIYKAADGATVVGGGLASIDIVKILMIETTRAALCERGIEVSMLDLETRGIPKTLVDHGLVFGDLGLEGCTLYYRRRPEDMSLVAIPRDATPEREAKSRNSRGKLLDKAMRKYCFNLETLCEPDKLIIEDDRLVGLRFRRTRIEDGKLVATDRGFERRGPYVVSSIGSIPMPIEGIEADGELFRFSSHDLGRLDGFPTVFSAGNIVTGKGNIAASRQHADHVTAAMTASFLGVDEEADDENANIYDIAREKNSEVTANIVENITTQPHIKLEVLESIRSRVKKRQDTVGYEGDLEAWIASVTPEGFE